MPTSWRHILLILTLLATCLQTVAKPQIMFMLSDASITANTSEKSNHCQPLTSHDPAQQDCCANDISVPNNNSCCDSDNTCIIDCNHCLTISITTSLFDYPLYLPAIILHQQFHIVTSHFHSVDTLLPLRPPIA